MNPFPHDSRTADIFKKWDYKLQFREMRKSFFILTFQVSNFIENNTVFSPHDLLFAIHDPRIY